MEQDLATHPEGHHIIAELSQCKNIIQYNDDKALKELLRISIEAAGMTPVEITTHNFRESGISGIGILIESHMSAHFWPAIGLIEFDCYTCGKEICEDCMYGWGVCQECAKGKTREFLEAQFNKIREINT